MGNILAGVDALVEGYQKQVDSFKQQRCRFNAQDVDLVFEFQHYMEEEITHAQKKLATDNNFTFIHTNTGNAKEDAKAQRRVAEESCHVADLTNKLCDVLSTVRLLAEAVELKVDRGAMDLRKCPSCGEVWLKVEGCPTTTCGAQVNRPDCRRGNMATFSFQWDTSAEVLNISQTGQRAVNRSNKPGQHGCGASLNWDTMIPVTPPADLYSSGGRMVGDTSDKSRLIEDAIGVSKVKPVESWEQVHRATLSGLQDGGLLREDKAAGGRSQAAVEASVVLLGDLGAGKSTLVQKARGGTNRVDISSAGKDSATRAATAYTSDCGKLRLIDCPGANAIKLGLEHNLWIAQALSWKPVNAILIVVKAEERSNNVIEKIQKYATQFRKLSNMIAVCVTHMDQVTWSAEEGHVDIQENTGIKDVIFTGGQFKQA